MKHSISEGRGAAARAVVTRGVLVASAFSLVAAACADGAEFSGQGEPGAEGSVGQTSDAICSNPLPPPLADISRGAVTGVQTFRFTGSDHMEPPNLTDTSRL